MTGVWCERDRSSSKRRLKFLSPRPQFDFPRPRIARLIKDMQIALRDGIGIEQRVRLVWRLAPARTADASIDHKMGDVNPLRCQFASHALCQAAQRELAHREWRRLCIAFNTG